MYNRYIPCEDGLHRRIPFPEEPPCSDIPPSAARSPERQEEPGKRDLLSSLLRKVTSLRPDTEDLLLLAILYLLFRDSGDEELLLVLALLLIL